MIREIVKILSPILLDQITAGEVEVKVTVAAPVARAKGLDKAAPQDFATMTIERLGRFGDVTLFAQCREIGVTDDGEIEIIFSGRVLK